MSSWLKNETDRVKKYEFEFSAMSRLIAFSGFSGPSGFDFKDGNQWFFKQNSNALISFSLRPWKKKTRIVLEKNVVQNPDESFSTKIISS